MGVLDDLEAALDDLQSAQVDGWTEEKAHRLICERGYDLLAVGRAAQATEEANECANFGEGSKYNCYREPEQGWAIELLPCLYCALMTWLQACGVGQEEAT